MLIVMGYIHLAAPDVADYVADIDAITPATMAAQGCLFYRVMLDDGRTGRVLVVERWRDQQALTAHLATARARVFLEKWMGRLEIDVQKYTVLNEPSPLL